MSRIATRRLAIPIRRLTLAALAIAALSLAEATPLRAQTLIDALVATYESNPSLLAARAELRAVNEGVAQANAAWKPSIVLEGSVGSQASRVDPDLETFNSTFARGADLTVRQPLYQGGSIDAGIASAEAVVRAQRALLLGSEQTVLLGAVLAYMNVWRDQAVLELNRANEERLRRQLEATQQRFEVGELTRTDVSQAESRLAGATAARIASEGDLQRSFADFRQITGLDPTSIVQAPPASDLPESVDATVSQAVVTQPQVVAARELESAALSDVRARFGDLLPNLSLLGTLSYSVDEQFEDVESSRGAILAVLTIPIYQQGLTYSRLRQAKQTANQRRLELADSLRQAEKLAVDAWEIMVSARAQIVSFRAQVQAATVALQGVTLENEVGARTVLDVLDAEQELLDAQVSLVRAQRDEVVASYGLLATVGRMTATDLGLPVAIYNPEPDYQAVRNAWFGTDAPGTP